MYWCSLHSYALSSYSCVIVSSSVINLYAYSHITQLWGKTYSTSVITTPSWCLCSEADFEDGSGRGGAQGGGGLCGPSVTAWWLWEGRVALCVIFVCPCCGWGLGRGPTACLKTALSVNFKLSRPTSFTLQTWCGRVTQVSRCFCITRLCVLLQVL